MNPNELRSLQEAYLEVVENQQQLDEAEYVKFNDGRKSKVTRMSGEFKKPKPLTPLPKSSRKSTDGVEKLEKGRKAFNKSREVASRNMLRKEEVSVYDIVLSHLLDEGYADTVESAEGIMLNMSEEWRESIVDETINEGRRTSLSALSRESQQRKADKERGRPETQDEKHRRLAMGRYSPSQYKWKKVDGQWKNMGRKDGEKD